MNPSTLAHICAAAALVGLIAYAILGGADFGGGVWDLFAHEPGKAEQRAAIEHAMGPVWEANHVWLIFVIVILFTCFPSAYAVLCEGLFFPMHVALVGIILRGAAFVFRKYSSEDESAAGRNFSIGSPHFWGRVFGVASIITPVLLGASFGAVTSGALRVNDFNRASADAHHAMNWLTAYSASCGLLSLSTCAYLAAVFLVVETTGEVREDFRRRAIASGTSTAVLAGFVLIIARFEAPWFYNQLFSRSALPVVGVGMLLFAASAVAVFFRRYRMSCVYAVGQVIALLLGWGVAHRQYVIYPDFPVKSAAAPDTSLRFVIVAVAGGLVLLLPSLWLLFHVFKRKLMRRPPRTRKHLPH